MYEGEDGQVTAAERGRDARFYENSGKIIPSTGETTIFVYDAVGKLAPSTPATKRSHPSSGRRGAVYSTVVAAAEDARVAYLTADHLGSPRINTDRDGKVTSRHDYHPYGEEIITAQRTSHEGYTPDSVRKQFTGYERDGETGLDFAQARTYQTNIGRFSGPDPVIFRGVLGPQAWNKYIYVLNNPGFYTDPTGLMECPPVCSEEDLAKFYDSRTGTGDIGVTGSAIVTGGGGVQIDGNGINPYITGGFNLGVPGLNITITGSRSSITRGYSSQAQASGLLITATSSRDRNGQYTEALGGQIPTGPNSFIPSIGSGGVFVPDFAPTRDIFQRFRMLSAVMAENSRRYNAANPVRMCLLTICGGPNRSTPAMGTIRDALANSSSLIDQRFEFYHFMRAGSFQAMRITGGTRFRVGRLRIAITKVCDSQGKNCTTP